MRILAVALLAIAVAACDGAPSVTPGPTPTASAAPTETLAPTTPPPTSSPTLPSATPGPVGSPGPTPIDILPLLTSEITVVNLDDRPLSVTVTLLSTDSPDEYEVGTVELLSFQVTSQSVIPTRLRLEFEFVGSGAAGSACTIDVAEGEHLQFAALTTGVAITVPGQEPANSADLLVATAPRCRAGTTS